MLKNATGQQKLAVWSTVGEQNVSLDVGLDAASSISALDGKGQPQAVQLQDRRLRLSLGPLPAYVAFGQSSPVLAAAAAWKVQEPYRRSIVAGAKDGLAIDVKFQNPFPHPVRVEATLALSESTVHKTLKLGAGKSAELKLAATVSRRDAMRIPASLTVEMSDPKVGLLGRCTEPLQFQLSNPLHLTVAPVQTA